jgi:hypothetical protein
MEVEVHIISILHGVQRRTIVQSRYQAEPSPAGEAGAATDDECDDGSS